MDVLFLEGVAATVAAIIVFCGSVFLLLAMVLGGRLAYFLTASITLAFLLMMGIVWSINPLGPVGKLPEWDPLDIGPDPAQLDFGPAAEYPEGGWQPIDTEDEVQAAKASELEGAATDYLETAIERGDVDTFESASDAAANSDLTRLLEQGGREYGAVTLEPAAGQGQGTVVVMSYDAGDPLGPPRVITAGTLILLLAHLFGLSVSERRARETVPSTP
jgi:hypothetical protein